MLPVHQIHKFLCFVLIFVTTLTKAEDENLVIQLNKTLTYEDKELFGEIISIKNNSVLHLTLINVNKKVDFIVVQAHSHIYNITLNDSANLSISGTNVGLYGTVKPPNTYLVSNMNNMSLKVYISVHGYSNTDPIPGGCNLVGNIPIPPFMHIAYDKDMVQVDAAAAKVPNTACGSGDNLDMTFYRMYLDERDFSEDGYFKGLKDMMTWDKIMANGYQVPQTLAMKKMRRFLSAYPGTGSIYVMVATVPPNRYSVYVPTHTYACSPLDGCEVLDDFISQFFCAGLIFIGLFTCFLGHRFFRTEMFLAGAFAGVIITYILLSNWTDLERPALLGASLLTGTFFGAIWILTWWFYGIPVLSVALATMHLGFLMAAVVIHAAYTGSHDFFEDDGRFWTIFILIMLLCSFTLTTVSYQSNILCCSVLGAYAVVFATDHYVGSSLKYLMYNTVRRAVVPQFNYAILALPYQWKDVILTLIWLGLAVGGYFFQRHHNRGRPPFPPPPRSINLVAPTNYGTIDNRGRRRFWPQSNGVDSSASAADERRPLLAEQNVTTEDPQGTLRIRV
ncbi:transmembrane 7 superfamily member 3 [Phthorimaea operculella]|nr:transmembrane 7 superfamily member 3 [Phthorimaea operculella]